MKASIQHLEGEVAAARDDARAAADQTPAYGAEAAPQSAAPSVQLMDISLNIQSVAGLSTASDDELPLLQGGGHDPRRRGFSMPNMELSFLGAVDPYFTGEAHLLYFLDAEGESRFEIEEAFALTSQLPFGLQEYGLEIEFGQFLTEFGRQNPIHAHAWHWIDQPIILSRLFGEDGARGPGVRLGWLTPLPWFSEVHLGAQNAQGETMPSFLANAEVFEERPIGGRPFGREPVTRSPDDLAYLARWVNGFDLSDTVSTQLGVSSLWGPNATGPNASTWIWGADAVLKWSPLNTDRGWPFLLVEGEVMGRRYSADSFLGCAETGEGSCDDPVALGRDTLDDWGLYAQLLYGFRRGWAAGLRYEYATGSGASIGEFESRLDDPFRDDRHRVGPLLVYHPSEFSRLRLQYNYDHADHLGGGAHSLWLGLEIALGSHAAHGY
jgi:hypothetical protein